MNIAHLLRRSAQLYPTRPAVLQGDQLLLTYQALGARTAALAACLRERHGVLPGDRVTIYAANAPEYMEALHAILWAGCTDPWPGRKPHDHHRPAARPIGRP